MHYNRTRSTSHPFASARPKWQRDQNNTHYWELLNAKPKPTTRKRPAFDAGKEASVLTAHPMISSSPLVSVPERRASRRLTSAGPKRHTLRFPSAINRRRLHPKQCQNVRELGAAQIVEEDVPQTLSRIGKDGLFGSSRYQARSDLRDVTGPCSSSAPTPKAIPLRFRATAEIPSARLQEG